MLKRKLFIILSFILFLVGCGRTLQSEAIYQARNAILAGDYAGGSLLLLVGCEDLHAQSVYLLHMENYESVGDLMGMVHAWLAIENIESSSGFVQEEAYRFLNDTLGRAHVNRN